MRKHVARRSAQVFIALLFSLLTSHFSLRNAALASDQRPNVLLIVGDDHSADVYGAYGNPRAQTPNLDRLAAEGVRFDRAFCNSPMCTSSRQSFLTGRYAHSVGVTMLSHALGDDAYTLAHRLREKGYRTAAFGKMHFNAPRLHGFEVHLDLGDWQKVDRERRNRPLPEGVEVQPPWKPFRDPARIWLNGFYRPYPRYDDEMPDSWYAEQAITFMESHRDEPFFVQLGFHEPHSPYWFPVEFAKRFDPASFTVPPIGPEDVPQIPRIFADLTVADKQGIRASYYTSVAFLDEKVGQVLAALDRLGERDDTLVVYLGDHGYHLGEHGRIEKHCFFERPVRAPLVMRFPHHIREGGSNTALVEFVDVVPTVLDYLGVESDPNAAPPRDLHGLSLRPLIEAATPKLHDAVFSEYQPTQEAMVRTERYKLIYHTGTITDWLGYEPLMPPEGRTIRLYDLKEDPEEYHNVAGDPANAKLVADLLDRLADWYRRTPPAGDPPPAGLSREAFLDWAIAPRNPPPPRTR